MATNHLTYFPKLIALWVVLGVSIALAMTRARIPSTKLLLIRISAIVVGVLFLGAVWFLSGSLQEASLGLLPVAVIVALNFLLVKVCPQCAATVRPHYFAPAAFCPRCGASMAAPMSRSLRR